MANEKHLNKLPPKSYKVAPGSPVGGMVFVMDKPCGIEEGMVGISMDSEPYRNFIRENLKNEPFNKKIASRLNATNTPTPSNSDELIDWILKDSQISKKGFFNPTYKENGLSGMFFDEYKKKLEIKDDEKFYKQIAILTGKGNKVYMVKQDGPMVLGGSGPTIPRIKMTTTYKKNKKKYGGFIANTIALGQRAYYIIQNRPKEVNQDAIVETLSTKLAGAYGMNAQEIDTIEGTYKNGEPKVCTVVTWNNGVNDLSGHLLGGDQFYSGNVCISSDTTQNIRYETDGSLIYKVNEEYQKLLSDGSTMPSSAEEYNSAIFVPVKVADDNETIIKATIQNNEISFSKTLAGGTEQPATADEYNKAHAVSDHNIHGMGESLITMLSLGDRDGIGKKGQNKAIMPILDDDKKPTGEFEFFGIDFGKAYNGENKLLPSLSDNFYVDTFDTAGANTCFPNYAMLYDNPLTEKMKGVYLLAAQTGKLTDPLLSEIANEYKKEFKDPVFANKLKEAAKEDNQNPHLKIIDKEIDRVRDLSEKGSKKEQKQYQDVLAKLEGIKVIMQDNDSKILAVFEERKNLLPTQIHLLDNMEKLTAKSATNDSNGVRLNHIKVENTDRVPWQLNKEGETFTLSCKDTTNLTAKSNQLLAQFLSDTNSPEMERNGDVIQIKGLTLDQVTNLSTKLSEEEVAQIREIPLRKDEHRQAFNQNMKIGKIVAQQKTPEVKHEHKTVSQVSKSPGLILSEHRAPNHALDEQLKQKYKQLTTSFGESKTVISEQKRHVVLQEPGMTLNELKAKLNQPEMKNSLGIIHVCERKLAPFKNNPGLEIEFEIKDNDNQKQTFKGYAEEIHFSQKSNVPRVEFSIDKGMNAALETQAIQQMCALAIASAKPNTEFNLSDTPEDKREIVQKALENAIEQCITENIFKEGEEPKIIEHEAPTHRINPISGG